jgi:hypothetical protein
MLKSCHSPQQNKFHREDSIISSINQDEETVVVETWIDSETVRKSTTREENNGPMLKLKDALSLHFR